MIFQIYKYFFNQNRKSILIFLAGASMLAILTLETDYTLVVALLSYFAGNLYLSMSKDNHKILASLPLSRSQIFTADYLAYSTFILIVNLMVMVVYSLLASMLSRPSIGYPEFYMIGYIFLAIVLSIVRKCLYDYFTFYKFKSLLITVPIMIVLILSLALGTKAVEHLNIISANYFMFSTGTIILLVIFLVTKNYFERLDF